MKIRLLVAAVALAAVAAVAAGCGEKRQEAEAPVSVPLNVNLIENPSFETWNGTVPMGWKLEFIEGGGKQPNMYGQSSEEKRSGSYSFYLRGFYNVDKWIALTQRHPVIPGHRLRYGGEMKSKDIKKNRGQEARANIYIRFFDRDGKRVDESRWADGQTRYLLGTTDWRKRGRRVDVPKEARTVEIGLVCQMTGWVFFDDMELVLEEPIPWKKVETKYVDFFFFEEHPFPEGAIEREAKYVERAVKKLALDPKPEEKISYYYYPSDERFEEIKGGEMGPTHSRMIVSSHELHTTRSFDEHEIVHLLLEPLGYPPFGLAEGAVFHAIGSWEGGRNVHMMAKDLLLGKQLPALYHIVSQKAMNDAGLMIAVPGWASFSMWLIDRRGIEPFMKLYVGTNEVEDAASFRSRFKTVYGREFEEMDREWRLWVLRYQPKV